MGSEVCLILHRKSANEPAIKEAVKSVRSNSVLPSIVTSGGFGAWRLVPYAIGGVATTLGWHASWH